MAREVSLARTTSEEDRDVRPLFHHPATRSYPRYFPNAWRAAELASMVPRGTDHCAARRALSEGWWWSRAGADDVGPDSATPSILT